jgi:hydroxymethylglutaryl-CoA synthase
MVGITSYGAHIPMHRLTREEIGRANGTRGGKGEKAICGFDEDSLTMAVAAAVDCLKNTDRKVVDGLYLATTTAPYVEKMISTTAAAALDLRTDIGTLDLTNSLRAGTGALLCAANAVKAGAMKNVLVAAADCRLVESKSELEPVLGDGAAALLVGDANVAAEIEDSHSLSDEFMDLWRTYGDKYVRVWEDRFAVDSGYMRVVPQTVTGLLGKKNAKIENLTKVLFYAPNERRFAELGKRLKLQPEQFPTQVLSSIGNTGTALPFMLLIEALEEAKADDRILLVGYGNGCDAVLLRVTAEIERLKGKRLGIKGSLAARRAELTYQTYMQWRELVTVAPLPRPSPARTPVPEMWRDRSQNLALCGAKCRKCGTQQYPVQRVCVGCHAKDDFDLVRLSDKKATIFTFTNDNLAPSPNPPASVAVVDFDGGGRWTFDVTDRDPNELKVGMPVEPTFRRLNTAYGIHNYWWKVKPASA